MFYQSLLLSTGVLLNLFFATAAQGFNSEPNNMQQEAISDTLPQPDQPELAPGTARIKGNVLSISEPEEADGKYRLAVQVEEVLNYGSSTPPIAQSDTLQIASYESPEGARKCQNMTAIISYRQLMTEFEEDPALWLLVKIEEN